MKIKLSGHLCEVEHPDGGFDEEEFRHIVIAPDGMRFAGYQTRTMPVKYLNHKKGADGRNLRGLRLEQA